MKTGDRVVFFVGAYGPHYGRVELITTSVFMVEQDGISHSCVFLLADEGTAWALDSDADTLFALHAARALSA